MTPNVKDWASSWKKDLLETEDSECFIIAEEADFTPNTNVKEIKKKYVNEYFPEYFYALFFTCWLFLFGRRPTIQMASVHTGGSKQRWGDTF